MLTHVYVYIDIYIYIPCLRVWDYLRHEIKSGSRRQTQTNSNLIMHYPSQSHSTGMFSTCRHLF